MKRLLTYTLLLTSILGFTATAGADDRWATLRAINWVENPTNHARMGRFGELGPYQFRTGTWKMHTKRPFNQATQRAAADEVAVKHYEWLKRTLSQAGVDPNAFNIAMAWNCGVDNVLKGRVPAVSYDYATRVTNLVQTFKEREPATVAAAPGQVARPPVLSLESPVVNFALAQGVAPQFDLVVPPPSEDPVVYTDREPMIVAETGHRFTFTTAATLTPRFSL
ncbi:hypothetical protein [Lacunisphaera limnophila]|nr:hypothetical protein [Lacunisphaera limnophila]